MKINWGAKLAFFAILFMAFVVYMVIKISQSDMPLVEEDYYEKGIAYQKDIDKQEGASQLININVAHLQAAGFDSNALFVFLQKQTVGDTIYGSASFYRPSDVKLDFRTDFRLIDSVPTAFDVSKLNKGKWKVILNWQKADIDHKIEKEIEL